MDGWMDGGCEIEWFKSNYPEQLYSMTKTYLLKVIYNINKTIGALTFHFIQLAGMNREIKETQICLF